MYQKTKFDKRNTCLVLIQIQNRIKIKTTQIKRKHILTKDEDEKIDTHEQYEIEEI